MRFIVATIAMIFMANPAYAWGEFGHVLICEIAYRSLSDPGREELNKLIESQTFRDEHGEKRYPSFNHSCLREDKVRRRPKEHYINYPRDHRKVINDKCPGKNPCLLSAIRGDIKKLKDKSLHPNDRFVSLMALGHWIGDIHQPLHVSFADDRGGNSIKKRGRCKSRNLHAVWDSCILERKILHTNQPAHIDGFAEFTPMYRAADWMIEETTKEQIGSWIASEPWQWAAESFDLVRESEVGYCTKKEGACWYSETKKEFDGIKANMKEIRIKEIYLEKFRPVVIERLKQAGFRLAAVIDKALEN